MVTMMKEKVNTHFSFPHRLDMSPYMESSLIRKERLLADTDVHSSEDDDDVSGASGRFLYELIGVTVHTGTAEGGHYYSFIRDKLSCNELGQHRWYLFNDGEVKSFDPGQLANECFGGEMTSKTYDCTTEKFLDLSFEKTHSAYMLFYERVSPEARTSTEAGAHTHDAMHDSVEHLQLQQQFSPMKVTLSTDLSEWIWRDNRQFLQVRS